MKKQQRTNMLYIALLLLAVSISSCKSDSDEATPNLYVGVPTGTIVSLAERNEVLTGDPKGLGGRIEGASIIWWKNEENIFLDCSGNAQDDFTDGNEYSFGTDGVLYVRLPGQSSTETAGGNWNWSSSSKDGILYQGVEFAFTELNESAVTYASRQESGGQCIITYQKFIK